MNHAQHQLHVETKLDQKVAVSSLRCCWLCCPISHLLHTGREMGTAEKLAFCGRRWEQEGMVEASEKEGTGYLPPCPHGSTHITDTLG